MLLLGTFSLLLIISSLGIILSRDTLKASMFSLLAGLLAGCVFILNSADFIALTVIIIYTASSLVFFFAAFISTNNKEKVSPRRIIPLGIAVSIAFITEMILWLIPLYSSNGNCPICASSLAPASRKAPEIGAKTLENLGYFMYQNAWILLIISGIIVFTVMIANINILSKNKEKD